MIEIYKLFFTPKRMLRLSIAVYIVIFSFAGWYKFNSYRMGFDLGVHQQVLWNSMHGRLAATSAFEGIDSYLGIDFIPTEILLTPFYAIFSSIEWMMIMQTIGLALGAFPLYRIVGEHFHRNAAKLGLSEQSSLPNWVGVAFALAYLLYLPVEYMNLYEFQIRAFATTFLLWAWYCLERQQFKWFAIWSILALGCRSEVGLVLAGMGLYALVTPPVNRPIDEIGTKRYPTLFGVLPIVVGLAWFITALTVIVPAYRNGQPSLYLSVIFGQIDGQAWLGNNIGEIFRTLLTKPFFVLQEVFGHPERGAMRIRYLIEIFVPFAFLAFLRPQILLITVPMFGINLLSNTPNIHASSHYHYNAFIIPFIAIASAYGLAWLVQQIHQRSQNGRKVLMGAIVALVLLAGACNILLFSGAPFNSRNPALALLGSALKNPGANERVAVIKELLAQVPEDAALAATNKIGPFASQREQIYFYPGNVIYPASNVAKAEYLMIDQDELLDDENTRAERRQMLLQLATGGEYQLISEKSGISLWQRTQP